MTPTPIDLDILQDAIENEFECARCGHCCKGDGLVHFNPSEAEAMAAKLNLTKRQFLKTSAIAVDPKQGILRDKMVRGAGVNGADEKWCIFLERGNDGLYLCRVNEAKPEQCGSFPRAWRNSDSLQSCVGLRALMARLRRRTPPAEPS
jgi:Fe-S-cluster containining protein